MKQNESSWGCIQSPKSRFMFKISECKIINRYVLHVRWSASGILLYSFTQTLIKLGLSSCLKIYTKIYIFSFFPGVYLYIFHSPSFTPGDIHQDQIVYGYLPHAMKVPPAKFSFGVWLYFGGESRSILHLHMVCHRTSESQLFPQVAIQYPHNISVAHPNLL